MSRSPSLRLAMWSGPRNISTAMMRSFGNRSETVVVDEPLYAHYLLATGVDHPGRDEVIAADETDWRLVASRLTGPIPGGKRVWYQKHMGQHLLPGMDRGWIAGLTNCFLIREPREVITSFIKVVEKPTAEALGLPQQVELFEAEWARTGRVPPVVDSRDILEDPRGVLTKLCEAVGIPFEEGMLAWPPGRRETDGVWAPYWYASVEKSTGFGTHTPKHESVPEALLPVLAACEPLYARLYEHRLH
ncbi:MAG: HAD family hydrolase [Phycisphaerales bacterium]|nr:HAD family hydrolase [Phycisphaerales bacterium]